MMSSATKTTTKETLAQKRALLASRLQKAAGQPRQSLLSFAQQRLWFLDQLEPNSPLYNIGSVARIDGLLDTQALQESLNEIVARHETLRTRFGCPDETPFQIIDPHRGFTLRTVNLDSVAESDRQSEADQLTQAELNRAFDLSSEHPFRAILIHLGPAEQRLVLILHHIIADDWSLHVFFNELTTLYTGFLTGKPAKLPSLGIQYSDYGRWQRQWLQGEMLRKQLDYWKSQLRDYPPVTELCTDHPRGSIPTFRGKTLSRDLGGELTERLRALAKQHDSTLFMVLLAAFKALVHRYTQQEDLIICSPVAGRNRVETETLIGFFVNTLPLRTQMSGDSRFEELLARVRHVTLGAIAHQDLPFDRLVEELQPERTLSHLPFTKLMFSFQAALTEKIELPGATLHFMDVEPELAKFDITLVLRETSRGLQSSIEYNRDLFEAATIKRLLGHFETLLEGVVANPQQRLSELPLLSSAEKEQVLVEWNKTSTVYPRDCGVHELFEAQAAQTPDAIALVWGHQRMSYGELNSRANQLARFLRQFEIKPDVPVGLCVSRSPEMVVGMLGILKAGGAYVPLDANYPKERLAFMLKDVGAPVILTQQRLLGRVPCEDSKVICLDADWELIAREQRENTACLASAQNLAYVIYTSGSTGRPKGVAVPHRAINRLVLNTDYIQISGNDRIAQASNASFDAATFEVWGALLNGAQLVGISKDVLLLPADLVRTLRREKISILFLTTALFNQLAAQTPDAFATLRTVLFGGESVDPKWVKAVLAYPPEQLLHVYGPTENTTFSTWHRVCSVSENAKTIPIGRPIANTQCYVLDQRRQLVPIGVPGELYTGGDGAARGYWKRPELSNEKFVPNPFDSEPKGFLYKTGDLARFLADGKIEFLGRIDDQVKIRGFRVELGEVEALLGKHPGVRECVVTVYGSTAAEKRLVAHVVAGSEPPPNASELRSFLRKQLPDYMLPSAFVGIEALPLTPNGKVDRKALPVPDQTRPKLDRQYMPPGDAAETQLVSIWESVLGVKPIGIQDKFFDLGGHSMLAVKVISQIEKAFGRKLKLATLFQAPTIERLAAVLREEIKEASVANGSSLVEVQPAGSRPPLFLVHGAGGGMFWGYINLARCLGTDQPVYGFKSRGLDGQEEFKSIEEMAARYISDLRKLQARGPYYLGGYCFGGNVAYEMACQLAEHGEKVGLLALLNCAPPHSSYSKIPWTPRWWLRFARNLIYWVGYFAHWSGTQRREFFKWKWQLLKKRLACQMHAGDLSKVEPGDFVDLSSYTEDQKRTWEAHLRGLMHFRPRNYKGRVHLFRSPGHPLWCSYDENYGWGELVDGGVELRRVAGAHEKILEEPWVKELANELAAALRRAQNASAVLDNIAQQSGSRGTRRAAKVDSNSAVPGRLTSKNGVVTAPGRPHAKLSEARLEYWKELLGKVPELLDLPTDRPRPAINDGVDAVEPIVFSSDLCRKVQNFANEQHFEANDILLGALAGVLERYTGAHQIVIGSNASQCQLSQTGRAVEEQNILALSCDLEGNPSFRELVKRIQRFRTQALANGDVPFAKVVEALRPNTSSSYSPIFQVFFSIDQDKEDASRSEDCAGKSHISVCDLVVHLSRTREGLSGRVEYRSTLFDSVRILRLTEHLETFLRSALAEPNRPVAQLDLLPAHETKTLLIEWASTEKPYPHDKTLADLFRDQALRTPNDVALVCGTRRLTYLQLLQKSSCLAQRLKDLGIGPESLVGICLGRSAEMVIAILGTLLAGGAYVPLDPKYPRERLGFTLEDAKAKVLITHSELHGMLPRTDSTIVQLDTLDDLTSEIQTPATVARPESLAYVIYTSGSTGKPKGVALEHRNAVEMVYWAKDTFSSEELSGVLFSTSICFDLSVFELFVPLCWGGKVILAENALSLAELPHAGEVRLINTVPSAMRELLRLRAVPPTVQVVNLAGEPLSTELADQIYRETSVMKVYDLYGPTETTTYSTGGLRKPGQPATIGRPLANEQVYLLDQALRLVPIGNPGELYIGGDGVARGYLNRPELTADRFIVHPFKPDSRLYRTGDLARWQSDGTLEYLGRIDHQVKIRGFRIELGEIESVLKSHPGVTTAVVLAREDEPGEKRLAAYVVVEQSLSVTAEELKAKLRSHLPEFMTPADFVFLEAMPLTPNGKVDRKALPVPTVRTETPRSDLVAPRTRIEEQLVAIWSEVLRLKHISIRDNFFDLGGHSLLAVRVLSAIRDTCQLELPISVLFSKPTIETLAEVVNAGLRQNGYSTSQRISPVPRGKQLPLSYVQERLWFLDQLQPGGVAYNVPAALRLRGRLDHSALNQAFNQVVARHEALRSSLQYRDEALVQVISEKLNLEMSCIDLQSESEERRRETRAHELLTQLAPEPFDLVTGPLIRMTLVRLTEADHFLLVVMHHSVSDGWSLALFFQELAQFYDAASGQAAPPPLVTLSIQYPDYAHWQRHYMAGDRLKAEQAYWKQNLAGAPPQVALPFDHSQAEQPSGRANIHIGRLDRKQTQRLGDFARAQGCTPFMVFLAALAVTLRDWTGQEDLVLGTVVAGRTRRELEHIIGCFMNFLPLRLRLAEGLTVTQVLASARDAVLDAQTHQECPFEKIVEAVNPQRRRDQNPLYNVGLLLQNFPANLFQTKSLQASSVPVSLGAALLDLRFEIEQADDGLSLICEYKTDLFDSQTIERLMNSWVQVIDKVVTQPESRISELKPEQQFPEIASVVGLSKPVPANIVISATFTADPINEPLRFWFNRLELVAEIHFAPFNQVFQQLLDPAGLLASNSRGLNVILIRLEDWRGNEQSGSESIVRTIERGGTEFVQALKSAMARSSVPFLISFCPPSAAVLKDPILSSCLARVREQLENDLAPMSGVYVLSSEELETWYPVPDYYDPTGDELGVVPYTPPYFTALATGVVRKYYALNRPAYKVIVLDCDNTLWSGVCGEDGPSGVGLDDGRLALQQFMRHQKESGILLCLCSKNNEEDVQGVFSQRTEFPLQMKDLATCRLNWLPKSANLKSLSRELNLGLDSFIFIDDNPVECAEVQTNCPEVLALQLPENSAQIPQFLNHCWVFDHLRVTAEDRNRAELYQQNRLREQLRAKAPTLEDFLSSLELKVSIDLIAREDWIRVSQLTQRTNQFNTTTRRMAEQDLAAYLETGEGFVVRVCDRFGDYGLVGVVLCRASGEAMLVESLLLSCRVLGRGVEHRVVARLGEIARERKFQWVDLKFVPSAKNQPALDFLEQNCGEFKQPLNGGSVFRLPVGFAAELTFHPGAQLTLTGPAPVGPIIKKAGITAKAELCRSIALESNDVHKIHQQVRKGVSVRQRSQSKYVAPKTQFEQKLCILWQELLHIELVGVADDFFELGGHSLLAVRLFAEIEKLTGQKFPLVTLFQAPTVEQLARVLSKDEGSGSLLVPIQPKGNKPPLFLVHGAGGDVLWGYANLATHLSSDQPIYGIRSHGQQGEQEKLYLEEMARSYLEVIRTRQPQGPYYLGGYCFGGNVAYEMARQLRIQGQEVALVVLLDTAPSNVGYETVPWWRPSFIWRFLPNLRFWLLDFMDLEPDDRRRLIGRKIRAVGRKLKRRLGFTRGLERFNVEEVIDPRHFPEHELKLWQIHLEALIAHIERPYDGRVALLRTCGQALFCSLEEDFCWGKLVRGRFTVQRIPGSHENIFMEPNVRVLATELEKLLNETHAHANGLLSTSIPCARTEVASQI